MSISSRTVVRAAALLSALPLAFFGYFTFPAAAATPTCGAGDDNERGDDGDDNS